MVGVACHFQFGSDDQRNPLTTNKKMVVKKQANCANCLEVKDRTELLDCARCRSVSYCSKDCQVIHWKKGGHKLLCVAVESSNEVPTTDTKTTTRGGEDDYLRVGFTKRGPRVIASLIVFIGLTFLLFKLGHLPFGLGHPNVEGQSTVASAPSPTILSPTTISSNKKKEEKIAAVADSQCKEESKSANHIKKVVDNHGSSVKQDVESSHNNIAHDKKSHISSGNMLSKVFERFRRNKNIEEGEAPGQSRAGPFKAIRLNFAEKLKSFRQIKPFLPVRNLVKRLKQQKV
jgi:hypothetical protein